MRAEEGGMGKNGIRKYFEWEPQTFYENQCHQHLWFGSDMSISYAIQIINIIYVNATYQEITNA